MNAWEAAREWRDRALTFQRRLLAIVDYCDQPDADIAGVKRILSGKDNPREET